MKNKQIYYLLRAKYHPLSDFGSIKRMKEIALQVRAKGGIKSDWFKNGMN